MVKLIIRNNLRKLRFNHNEMTQQQLAEKVGVTRQTIVAIEKAITRRRWNWLFGWHWFSTCRWRKCSSSKTSPPSGALDHID